MANKKRVTAKEEYDVALIGGGVLSATFGLMLHLLEPDWSIVGFERLPKVAKESSNPWNNAGTGHSGLCELNYSTENEDGSVNSDKALWVNEQFQISREMWASFVERGILGDPETFITPTPHMSFVNNPWDVEFLRKRYESLKDNPLFANMEFSEDPEQLEKWAPMLMRGRDKNEAVAATYDPTGTDVNFGSITRQFFHYLEYHGVKVQTSQEVTNLKQNLDGTWEITLKNKMPKKERLVDERVVKAKFVFVGAGGYALKLLQNAGLKEVEGYGLFPVGGAFLSTTDPQFVADHNVKIYGKPPVGAPPMSNPHLDARRINGARSVLFGPYASTNPKFLKWGSVTDLFSILRPHNIVPMLSVARDNLDLVAFLLSMIFMTKGKKNRTLKEFAPRADLRDFRMISAGQRAQIIKPSKEHGGTLEFGTEIITSADGTIAGVLGASPGASTAVPIMFDLFQRCFPEKFEIWSERIKTVIPSFGTRLSENPQAAYDSIRRTAEVLKLNEPTRPAGAAEPTPTAVAQAN